MTVGKGQLRRTGAALVLAMQCLMWIAASWAPSAWAQDDAATLERRVKAAFVFKFASYVEWPEGTFPQPGTSIIIAVLGDEELAAELVAATAGRTVDGRALVVRRTKTLDGIADAHMVFVGRSEIARLPQFAKIVRAKPTLIMTDAPNALTQGSMINFMIVQQRVKFEISLEEVERHGLKLSSRLLAVAHSVRKGSP